MGGPEREGREQRDDEIRESRRRQTIEKFVLEVDVKWNAPWHTTNLSSPTPDLNPGC